jgi:hypothetical protein
MTIHKFFTFSLAKCCNEVQTEDTGCNTVQDRQAYHTIHRQSQMIMEHPQKENWQKKTWILLKLNHSCKATRSPHFVNMLPQVRQKPACLFTLKCLSYYRCNSNNRNCVHITKLTTLFSKRRNYMCNKAMTLVATCFI